MKQRIGILGSGAVGLALAQGLRDAGYEVAIGRREAVKIENWDGPVDTFDNVARHAELIIFAVKGSASEALAESLQKELAGKSVLDTTNPISDKPPTDGVLSFFTTLDDSLMERLQTKAPEAHFVKAFNSVGAANMVKPNYGGEKPTMFICGNNETAKKDVTGLAETLGWEIEDMGTVVAARAIEPLCILWCIPGMNKNQWSHAFKLLKK